MSTKKEKKVSDEKKKKTKKNISDEVKPSKKTIKKKTKKKRVVEKDKSKAKKIKKKKEVKKEEIIIEPIIVEKSEDKEKRSKREKKKQISLKEETKPKKQAKRKREKKKKVEEVKEKEALDIKEDEQDKITKSIEAEGQKEEEKVSVEELDIEKEEGIEEKRKKYEIPSTEEKEKNIEYRKRRESYWKLPFSYDETKIVLLPRDPKWAFCYWDFSKKDYELLRTEYKGRRMILRVIKADGGVVFDTEVNAFAKNWYIKVPFSGAKYYVKLGILDKEGRFKVLASSNTVEIPRYGISKEIDTQWMEVKEYYEIIVNKIKQYIEDIKELPEYKGLSSAEIIKKINENIFPGQPVLPEGIKFNVSGAGISSKDLIPLIESEIPERKGEGLFLEVETILVIKGRTNPDADLRICGAPIEKDKQGNFKIEFALGDGEYGFPIKASRKGYNKIIIPVISKKTK